MAACFGVWEAGGVEGSARRLRDDLIPIIAQYPEFKGYICAKSSTMVSGEVQPKMYRGGHDARQVAKYVLWLAKDESVTPMKLLKLVYICHGWMLGLHGRPMIVESAEAWQYGPVVPSVYRTYKSYGGNPIPVDERPSAEPLGFDPQEQSVLRQVWDKYGRFNGIELSSLTHKQGTPWDITWKESQRGIPISNDLIEQHYKELARNH